MERGECNIPDTHRVAGRVGQLGGARAADQLQRERRQAVALRVAWEPRGGRARWGAVPGVLGWFYMRCRR
jgi:hypothetical protein